MNRFERDTEQDIIKYICNQMLIDSYMKNIYNTLMQDLLVNIESSKGNLKVKDVINNILNSEEYLDEDIDAQSFDFYFKELLKIFKLRKIEYLQDLDILYWRS